MPNTDSYVARLSAGDRRAGGGAQVRLAVLHRAEVDQLLPGREGEGDLALPGPCGGFGALPASSAGRAPSHGPRACISARTSATVRKPSGRPWPTAASSSAMPDEDAQVGQRGRVGEDGVEVARAAVPRHERAGLVGHRGDRQDDVGHAGHVGLAQLEADHEAGRVEGGAEGGGVGGVVGVDAADHEAAEVALGERGDDGVAVAADLGGQRLHAPRGGHVDAGRGLGERASAGQQVGQGTGLDRTAVTGAARAPRRGGHRCRRGEVGRGASAPRGCCGEALADEDDRVLGDAVLGVRERADGLDLGAGGGRRRGGPSSWLRPREVKGATDTTCVRPLRAALRSRRKIVAASSSGSRPSSTTTGAASRSA